MSKRVSYEKDLLETAKKHNKFLVTMAVYGGHLKDDSICVQVAVPLKTARRMCGQAWKLFRENRAGDRGKP